MTDIEETAKERKRVKAHKLLRNNEPVLSLMTYDHDILMALNHYNITNDNKEKKAWVVSHYGKQVKFSSDIPDYRFKTLGTLCRIVDNGNELSEQHIAVMEKELEALQQIAPVQKVSNPTTKPVIGIQEKMDQKVTEFLGEFAGLVDEYTLTRTNPNVEKLVNSMNIRGPMVK